MTDLVRLRRGFTAAGAPAPRRLSRRGEAGSGSRRRGIPTAGRKRLATLPLLLAAAACSDGGADAAVFAEVDTIGGRIEVANTGEPPGSVVDVFRESGEYLGRMTLPSPVPLEPNRPPVVHVTPEYLYVVTEGELDVPYISRLRIERGR